MTENILTANENSPSERILSTVDQNNNAKNETESTAINENELTTVKALCQYRPAIFWSIVVCMCTIMEGYDTILVSNFFAYPTFAKKYGSFDHVSGTYQLTAVWQVVLGNSAGLGAFFGTFANGYLGALYGPKKVLLGALLLLSFLITITFLAPNVAVLCVGEFLCGLPWGIFSTTAPAYSSEILPLPLRGYLTTYTNMCFIIGQLIAAGVLEGLLSIENSWSYRGAFAIQWAWLVLIFPILIFMPESPWHLVRSGNLEGARKSLGRLQSKSASTSVDDTLDMIKRTNSMEEQLSTGTSYLDCFRGIERRRTEIACMVFAGQVLSGINFASNSTYFYQQTGLSTTNSYKINLGGTAIALCATIVSWIFLMPYVGRRKIYLSGILTTSIILFVIGILTIKDSKKSFVFSQAALTLLWTCIFNLSLGQLGWAIPAEIGSTRLRQKTICLARNSFCVANILSKTIESYFMNPTEWNLRGYTSFFWCMTAVSTLIWTFFRLPETKNRTFEEIDILFAKKVPANKFASYNIEKSKNERQNSEVAVHA